MNPANPIGSPLCILIFLILCCASPCVCAETATDRESVQQEPSPVRKLLKKKNLPPADNPELYYQVRTAVLDATEWVHYFRKQDKSITLIRRDRERRQRAETALETLKQLSMEFARKGLTVNDVAITRSFMHKLDATIDQAVSLCTEESKRCGRYREDLEAVYECALKTTGLKDVIGCMGIEKDQSLF
jgi:hypothetical protein